MDAINKEFNGAEIPFREFKSRNNKNEPTLGKV